MVSIYFNCKKDEMTTKGLLYDTKKYTIREEFDPESFSDEFKKMLKIKAASVIYEG